MRKKMDYAGLPPREIERLALNIRAGEWAVESHRPLATLLGSCVAVCLFDGARGIAGMNHFMLPDMLHKHDRDEDLQLAGDACMNALLDTMLERGASRGRLVAKAFGGGKIFDSVHGSVTVGQRNVDFAQSWLADHGIPLVATDVLGPWARKIVLLPGNGDVFSRRITSNMMAAATVKREEADYFRTLCGNCPAPAGLEAL